MVALLPCPCCGGKAGLHTHAVLNPENGKHCAIECRSCGLNTGTFDTLAAVTAKWNRRAPQAREGTPQPEDTKGQREKV